MGSGYALVVRKAVSSLEKMASRMRLLGSSSSSSSDISYVIEVSLDLSTASNMFNSIVSNLASAVESGALAEMLANYSLFTNATLNLTSWSAPGNYSTFAVSLPTTVGSGRPQI